MFYLYFILNTISGSGYFGVTSNSVSRRFYEHCNNAVNTNKRTKLYDAMRSYGIESFDCYIVAKVDSYMGMFDLEKQAIKLARDKGLHLYNMTSGGEGGFVVPAEKINSWKEKLSKARKGKQPALGMKIEYIVQKK